MHQKPAYSAQGLRVYGLGLGLGFLGFGPEIDLSLLAWVTVSLHVSFVAVYMRPSNPVPPADPPRAPQNPKHNVALNPEILDHIREFPKIRGTFLRGPYKKDPTI